MLRLTEMLCNGHDVTPGAMSGRCVICGQETEHGHPVEFSDSFMNAPLLQDGNTICEYCNTIKNMKQLRTSMWLATPEYLRYFKREEAKSMIMLPPDPPFALYFTESYKKTGWQVMCARSAIAESSDIFPVGFDYNIIVIHHAKFCEDLATIEYLLSEGLTKSEIRTGSLKISTVKKRGVQWARDISSRFTHRTGDLSWDLAVYIS